jgi:hypothetical protein
VGSNIAAMLAIAYRTQPVVVSGRFVRLVGRERVGAFSMTTQTDWRKEKLAALLEAAVHAISRARYVFVISNIAGILILTGLFNSTFPWIRNSIERARIAQPVPPHLAHLEKALYEDLWTSSVPLLGIKFSVFDLSVLGSTALLVIAIWQYYCVRRENQIVSVIADQSKKYKSDQECVAYLYHGIAHYFVFTTRFFSDAMSNKRNVGPTIMVSILFFMPAWIPLLIVLSDLYTLFVPYGPSLNPRQPTWQNLPPSEAAEAIVRMAYALILGFGSFLYCMKCREYDRSTRTYVEQMKPSDD